MRVAVIGARCANQGNGAHLARFCVQAGHDVRAVLGTTEATAAEAAGLLADSTGCGAAPYADLDVLLAEAAPEALVISSPQETHARYLRRALDAGLHVLCEKPLVWGGADAAREAEELANAFLAAGLHLHVGAQWPYTLPTYRALFPDALRSTPSRFDMHMAPNETGAAMLPAALPHALSILAAVLPGTDATVDDIRVSFDDAPSESAVVEFAYGNASAGIESRVELVVCPDQPRPASYGFDGNIAHRRVTLDPFALTFEGGGRSLALPDPTPQLVRAFFAAIAAGAPERIDPSAVPGMRHLTEIAAAAPR